MRGISKTNATNAAVAFCNTVKDAGYTPGIYANTHNVSAGRLIIAPTMSIDTLAYKLQFIQPAQQKGTSFEVPFEH